MKIDFCYHTHTKRCGHASGEDEEYVLNAIKAGIKHLGFSDHVMLPGYTQPGIRGDISLLEDYVSSIRNLQEKYKDQITIYLGMECEYYPEFEEYYKSLYEKYGFDYLIQGQHCFINDKNEFQWHFTMHTKEEAEFYLDRIVKGMQTGLFKYIAHPDYFVTQFVKWDDYLEKFAIKLCKASVKYNVPLEINLGRFNPGNLLIMKDRMSYPYEKFWEIAGEYGVKVYIGRDAHKPQDLTDNHFDYALELVEKYHLNLQTKIK